MFAVLIGGAGVFAHLWGDGDLYATKVGEQQLVVLDDGTRMTLNTDTRVRVEIGPDLRSVNVQAGEALFEVAKDPRRPFVVHVADSEVVALGTVFSVRLRGKRRACHRYPGRHADRGDRSPSAPPRPTGCMGSRRPGRW